MFSLISHRMDAAKQVNSRQEAVAGLASVSLKRRAENAGLSNSIESRDKTLERGLEQVGRKDQSDKVSEGLTKRTTNTILDKIFEKSTFSNSLPFPQFNGAQWNENLQG